jgi:hypothetical protein
MRKSDVIRAIYAELRRTVADDIPDGDLLRLAHMIVQAQLTEADLLLEFGRAGVIRSFWSADVFDAMSDGGWRILEFEGRTTSARDDPDGGERRKLRNLIQRFLGPEWQHHQWSGPQSPQ